VGVAFSVFATDVITRAATTAVLPARKRRTIVIVPSGESLVIGMFAGVFGVAYFVYGKRTGKLAPLAAGALLCVYPYFIDSVLWLCVVGILLLAAPFVVDYLP